MRWRVVRSWLIAALSVLAVSACTSKPRAWVDSAEVEGIEHGDVAGLTAEQLSTRLHSALEHAKFSFGTAPADAHPWKFRLAVALTEPDPLEQRDPEVRVVLYVRQKGENDGLELKTHQKRSIEGNDVDRLQASALAGVDSALSLVVGEARALIDLKDEKNEGLTKRLNDADPGVQAAAVLLLVDRKDPSVLPVLLPRLKSDDPTTVRETVGLLVELKAPQAVNPIIDAATSRPPGFQREVIYAVSAIGGPDAEAYLDLVASGSDIPAMREAAAQALAELKTRKNRR